LLAADYIVKIDEMKCFYSKLSET